MLRDIREEIAHIIHTPPERVATEAITAFCLLASSADKVFVAAGVSQHLVVAGVLCTAMALGDGLKYLDHRGE